MGRRQVPPLLAPRVEVISYSHQFGFLRGLETQEHLARLADKCKRQNNLDDARDPAELDIPLFVGLSLVGQRFEANAKTLFFSHLELTQSNSSLLLTFFPETKSILSFLALLYRNYPNPRFRRDRYCQFLLEQL